MTYLTELNRARHFAGLKPLSEEQTMKINELLNEAAPIDVTALVMKGVDAIMNVGHAQLEVEVGVNYALITGIYEFPEHRTGLNTEVKKAVKPLKVTFEKNEGNFGEFLLAANIEFDDITDEASEKLEKAIKAKYKKELHS